MTKILIDRAVVEQVLEALETVLSDAYHRRFPECCGRPGIKCCGNPNEAWTPEDNKIMDLPSPVQRQLSDALRAALAEQPAEQEPVRGEWQGYTWNPYAVSQPKAEPLTDEEIYECERIAAIRHHRHKSSIRGQQITPADDPQWHFANAIIAAYERKNGVQT